MLVVCYLIIFLYLIYLVWISEPLFSKIIQNNQTFNPYVSIVISARNESDNIINLIDGLNQQKYPKNKFEIIIINDKSTDNTLQKLYDKQNEINNLKIINIEKTPKGWSSKKWALNCGIQKTKGDIIVQTDADCRHTDNWLIKMIKPFEDENIGFVAGPSYIGIENNFWNELLKLESIAQESFSYANSKRQLYLSCTARNIALEK